MCVPAPSLIWVLEPATGRSGDMMLDGVFPRAGRGRAVFQGRPAAGPWRQARCGQLAAAHLRRWAARARVASRSGHLAKAGLSDRREACVAERGQGVAAAAGQLAGHAQGGPVAAQPRLDLG